jgi:lactoylglutathione lyase
MAGPLDYVFDHVHVFCTDVEATQAWFVDRLGAIQLDRMATPQNRSSHVSLGGVRIFLREALPDETLVHPSQHQYGADHVGLLVTNLDATVAELRRRKVTIAVEPFAFKPGTRLAFVEGPDKIRVELIQRSPQ